MVFIQPLHELPVGAQAQIVRIQGQAACRLMEMGCTPNTTVRIVRFGWRRKLIQIELRGYVLTMRSEDAAFIEVTPLQG